MENLTTMVTAPPRPAVSRDLNPIEKVWSILRKPVGEVRPPTMGWLAEVILAAWNGPEMNLGEYLVKSVRGTLASVVEKEGDRIPH
jgi:hypothetical protein